MWANHIESPVILPYNGPEEETPEGSIAKPSDPNVPNPFIVPDLEGDYLLFLSYF
jgi:hypothetical protein